MTCACAHSKGSDASIGNTSQLKCSAPATHPSRTPVTSTLRTPTGLATSPDAAGAEGPSASRSPRARRWRPTSRAPGQHAADRLLARRRSTARGLRMLGSTMRPPSRIRVVGQLLRGDWLTGRRILDPRALRLRQLAPHIRRRVSTCALMSVCEHTTIPRHPSVKAASRARGPRQRRPRKKGAAGSRFTSVLSMRTRSSLRYVNANRQ